MEESQGETQLCPVRSPREPPHFRGKDMGTVSSFCRGGGHLWGAEEGNEEEEPFWLGKVT